MTDKEEWRHWAARDKVKVPHSYEVMTETGDIDLSANEEVEVLFKFITTRDTPPILSEVGLYPI